MGRNEKLFNEEVVFFMDDCSLRAHISLRQPSNFLRLYGLPFMTLLFQFLDPALLSELKRHAEHGLSFGDEKGIAEFIKKVHHDFTRMSIEVEMSEDFQGIGLSFLVVAVVYCMIFNEIFLRESQV
jgi:hypothetical protein